LENKKLMLSAEQILEKFNELISVAESFSSIRKQKILEMLDDLKERLIITPASSQKGFHGAYPGGFLSHTLSVIKCSKKLYEVWKELGADMSGYSQEELIFSAMFHDFGKIGDENFDHYIPETSDWHRKNQGKYYKTNPKIPQMSIPDRSLYLLQKYGIPISQTEFISIKVHDGPFDEANNFYYNTFDPDRKFKNNMPMILHQADFMSYRIEFESERNEDFQEFKSDLKTMKEKKINDTADLNNLKNAEKIFNELFGEEFK